MPWNDEGTGYDEPKRMGDPDRAHADELAAAFEDFTFAWAAGSIVPPLECPAEVASSRLSSPDPDDFGRVETTKEVGPPDPDKAVGPAYDPADRSDHRAPYLSDGADQMESQMPDGSADEQPDYRATEFDSSIADQMCSTEFMG